ncbi:phenylalanyl-tRNA synthetase, beta subunit [Vibrio vulnificus YJ016]|uniref:Phenylalanine--tRNA ligase beta subunit n=1 Tax=Vibrio vulnificus (strain YJ016) TaxID=196600 RepID=SYFB_VIBVY|nr:phenylalanine--tRNA ligase subunit beta [Vibrio vulnificus]Q7MK40.1 RecName: Full=Phenylalanine--tRNA ligase beta subunit; AltName: Full=Phenylalanyl-tRNA synthetase beta subunit; Short=PheRS [Vibrio vulnificus YJ016]ADV86273.1 phenylalanyl-tRNA synthetase beta chain [Vibrio vulnificus MO6-24/O]AMG12428.1 phenylalanine--tRNA ligase subunit beta [Vibrio vulnificus]EGQ9882199.1 phenylalanine--tRNA ligase subunit beta [Vibrio vulnificus]EGR0040004.1 phenylalanine--tRNA ligase subunit beta [Vib
MKFSESWLREWVNPAVTTDELTHQITMAGLEVDDVLPVAGTFNGVKVGHVVECGQHPDADKLRVTKVDVGEEELLDIVCGAANCRQGLKVAVATVGAVLPGDFKIKKAKLRGQPSHGMLCSFTELGIDVESDGIMELAIDAPIGMDFRDFLALNDVTVDVDLTSNRADCFSIRGMAREVGVLNRADVTEPSVAPVAPSIDDTVAIEVKAPAACPRYLGRVVKNVNVQAKTPLWMQEKLRRCGIRSIDPVVDITNFVLLEQGQPMHAFDLAKIDGGIVVRLAEQGEKITLLDGSEAELNADTLVVADHNKALAIAGIFGGEESGVTSETKDVLLECAFFAPDHIRGRARSYGLHTDSSMRFERGVDYALQVSAMERATALLVEICGGEVAPVVAVESEAELPKPNKVALRRTKLDNLLGHHIADSDVVEILERLGMTVETTAEGWVAVAPTWRFDIAIEQDLVEEVGRIYGYDNIPNQNPAAALKMHDHQEANIPLKRVRDLLVDRGYHEAITYSFVEPEQQKLVVPGVDALILPNPISAEMSAMRLGLIQGLLNTVVHNQKRQQPRVRLFEYGLRFIPCDTAENGMRQEPMLAGVIAGTRSEEHWNIDTNTVDFFDLKGDVEAILELSANDKAYSFVAAKHPALHPGQSAAIVVDGKEIGVIGTVHPELERKFGLNGRTIVFEIEWSAINRKVIPEAVALSKFPANRRDIAVVVDEAVASGDIVNACLEVGGEFLKAAKLFDVYVGKGVEEGKKSLAIALTLQSNERTLEDADIAGAVDAIVAHVSEKFGASLRD